MTMRRTLCLSVTAGVAIEGVLCGLMAMFGKFGPCGPANDITGVVFVAHLPSVLIAQSLPRSFGFSCQWFFWSTLLSGALLF